MNLKAWNRIRELQKCGSNADQDRDPGWMRSGRIVDDTLFSIWSELSMQTLQQPSIQSQHPQESEGHVKK